MWPVQRDIRFASAILGRRREFFHMSQTSSSSDAILELSKRGVAEDDIVKLASIPNIDWAAIELVAIRYGASCIREVVKALFPTRA